jgi:hypothetical protein
VAHDEVLQSVLAEQAEELKNHDSPSEKMRKKLKTWREVEISSYLVRREVEISSYFVQVVFACRCAGAGVLGVPCAD